MRTCAPRTKIVLLVSAVCLLILPLARGATGSAASASAALTVTPHVTTAAAFGTSSPLSALPKAQPPQANGVPLPGDLGEAGSLSHPTGNGSGLGVDPALQQSSGSGIPPTGQNFEGNDIGESSSDGVFVGAPPDTNGDVGPNDYVQIVNTVFSIYSKTGQRLVGPTPINNIWKSAPNASEFNCTTQSKGDPIVQYDPLADRWLISQFNFPGEEEFIPPFDECVAISQTSDPTGAYYLYDFRYSTTIFNDYPHIGVWPDAYYMSVNQFDTTTVNTDFKSAGACAFERAKMLTGDPNARQVCIDESQFDPKDANGNYIYGGQLPTDLDGTGVGANFKNSPPAGEPNFFMQFLDSTTAGQDKLLEFKFHVDWSNPANSTFGNGTANGNGKPIEIPVADFDSSLCDFDRACLPQKDSSDGLDAISDRLMYRVAYRNFGDHESLVLNHTVSVGDAANHAGIRWYEVRSPNSGPKVYQQGTYAPDAEDRWMGSAAMDGAGDIALGYSLTSANRHPAIAYTARRAGDPLGQMTLGEGLLYQGLGSQTGTQNRWGDYSSMSVDPNGCTFWYTQEHYLGTSTFNWGTRVGSFTLPVCGDPQLSLSSSASAVQVRKDYTYTIGVNAGQGAALGASVTDVLPAGVTLLGVSTTRGTCQGTATVVCTLGDLPAGDLEKITLTVHTSGVGTLTNTASLSVTSPDTNPDNNTSSVDTQVFDPCTPPGAVVATDPSGDQTGTPQQDLTSVAVGEPYLGQGVNKLVFTMKVANLNPTPQPAAYWYEYFSYGGVNYFVDMETNTSAPTPTFHYGRFDPDPTTGLNTENVLGDADSGTWNTDGTITITLSTNKLTQLPDPSAPPTGAPPAAGSVLSGIHADTRQVVGILLALVDTTSSGGYTLSGNDFCAPNTPPTAALQATPTNGSVPLTVAFDASASHDPDAGDSVASYTFRFGDGSTPVTQASPTISHTYTSPGTYHVSLTVTDSRGQESSNAAGLDITVTPSADLAVKATGPATAKNDAQVTYTITVTNNGPAAATGVIATDKLPYKAVFKSVKVSPTATCTKATANYVTTVTCKPGALASGATTTITVVAQLKGTAGQVLTDTASASETGPGDPDSSNNTSIVTTTVVR